MDSRPTQANRTAELTTALGKDVLLLTSFTIFEELSHPFEVRVECLSLDKNIDFGAALGRPASIKLKTVGKVDRHFSGILVDAIWMGEREQYFSYQITIRPMLWLFTQTSNCKIFQNMTVRDIIEKVLEGVSLEWQIRGSLKKIEYCVQYRETSFAFVSRLMETFGLYYFFKHSSDQHIMVVANAKSSHEAIPNLSKCPFAGMGERTRDDQEYVTVWHSGRRFGTGKVTVNTFDFVKPTADLKAKQTSPGGYQHDQFEIYDYSDKYKQGEESDLGELYANARLHAVQSLDRRRHASGDAPSLFPGGLTTLEKHPDSSENKEYLVVSAMHSFVGESFTAGGAAGGNGDSYSGSYVLQPSDRPFRAPIVTPRPIVHGPQTAIVVGPKGDEIYTDKHGRIKLKFHWDRDSKGDENSSRWVRVSQIWSGKGWGGIVIPRIGMEVVVEFIEGDPDRPLVVGTVYNGSNEPPYELAKNKTQAGLKTRSTTGGTESQYNELMFEDVKGSEFVRFHAEKDLDATIEDGETRVLKGKNKSTGKATRKTTIEKGDDVLDIDGDNNVTVGRNIMIEAGNMITLKVGPSKITMTSSMISIESPTIKLKSEMTDIQASATLTQTAGIIKLN